MKKLLYIIFLLSFSLHSKEILDKNVFYIKKIQNDSLLLGIQTKIEKTFAKSLKLKNTTPLLELSQSLENLYKIKKQNLIIYWQSYLHFYTALYYSNMKDKKNGKIELDKAIELLKKIKNKNSEDYALLSYLQAYSITFNSMMAPIISQKSTQNATIAINIDSTNIRAYYVLANNDFYTPKIFGGGKKVEKYLLKAILLPAQKIKNSRLPSWGKSLRYILLIKFYIREEQQKKAKKYYQKAIKLYPNDNNLNKLSEQLIEK